MVNMLRISVFVSALLGLLLGLTVTRTTIQAGQTDEARALIERFDLRSSPQPVRELANWRVPKKVVIWQNSDTEKRIPDLKAAYPSITFEAVSSAAELPAALKDADVFLGYCISDGVNSEHQLR